MMNQSMFFSSDQPHGPRRSRNKTKAERNGPRKRRRKKKKKTAVVRNDDDDTGINPSDVIEERKNNNNNNINTNKSNVIKQSPIPKRKLTRFELNKLDNNNNNRIPQETVKEEEFTLFSFYSQIIGPSTPLGGYSSGNNNNNSNYYYNTSMDGDSNYNNNNDNMNNSNNYHDNYQNTNVNKKKQLQVGKIYQQTIQEEDMVYNNNNNNNNSIRGYEETKTLSPNMPVANNQNKNNLSMKLSPSPVSLTKKRLTSSSNWIFSPSSVDMQNDDNRKWWTSYVVAAAEVERQRRIKLNDEEIDEEARERYERQEWARRAIEAEQQRINAEYESNQRNDTVKHIDESSTYDDNYIVVCPNVSKGCTYEGHLREIELHLCKCEFSHRKKDDVIKNLSNHICKDVNNFDDKSNKLQHDNSSYGVIMCPYSYFGCEHCCVKDELESHIQICEFRGKTREDEEIDRQNSILDAIQATEEEQQRRVEERHNEATLLGRDISNLATPFTALQQIMDMQTKMLQKHLGREILHFSKKCHETYIENRVYCDEIIESLTEMLQEISPSAFIATYGSYSTGLSIESSDLDLVISQCDTPEILVLLGKMLKDKALDWIDNIQIITTAIVPVLKFNVCLKKPRSLVEPKNDEDAYDDDKLFNIAVDITVGNENHSGIMTAAFVQKMISLMPHLKPITLVLKSCFSKSNLNDTFTGGIPSYGIFLIVLSIVLHLQHADLPSTDDGAVEEENISKHKLEDEMEVALSEKLILTITPPSSPLRKTKKSLSPKRNYNNNQHSETFESEKEHGTKLAIGICKNIQHIHEINFPSTLRNRRRGRSRSSSKHNQDNVLDGEGKESEDEESKSVVLGRLFMHILHFLGQTFEPNRDHISILHGGIFPRKDIPNDAVVDPLLLDDPLVIGNNVGRRCYRISEIQMKCANALTKLYRILNRFQIRSKRSSKNTTDVLESVFGTFNVVNVNNNNGGTIANDE